MTVLSVHFDSVIASASPTMLLEILYEGLKPYGDATRLHLPTSVECLNVCGGTLFLYALHAAARKPTAALRARRRLPLRPSGGVNRSVRRRARRPRRTHRRRADAARAAAAHHPHVLRPNAVQEGRHTAGDSTAAAAIFARLVVITEKMSHLASMCLKVFHSVGRGQQVYRDIYQRLHVCITPPTPSRLARSPAPPRSSPRTLRIFSCPRLSRRFSTLRPCPSARRRTSW